MGFFVVFFLHVFIISFLINRFTTQWQLPWSKIFSFFFQIYIYFLFFSQNRTVFGQLVRRWRPGQKIACDMSKCAPQRVESGSVLLQSLNHPSLGSHPSNSTWTHWGQGHNSIHVQHNQSHGLGRLRGPRSRFPSLTRSFMTLSVSALSSFPR